MSTRAHILVALVFMVQLCALVNGRYKGILRPDDETEALKKVIHFYKQQPVPLPDSMEVDSKEQPTAPSYQPAYRIDLDAKEPGDAAEPTDSPIVFSVGTDGSEEEQREEEIGVVTTIVPNPEEAEDETTTLFPVVKMEEYGIQSTKYEVPKPVVFRRPESTTTGHTVEVVTSTTTAAPPPECSEGDLRRRDCNTCICIDGRYICSKRTCPAGSHGVYAGDATKSEHIFSSSSTTEPTTTTTTTTTTTSTTTTQSTTAKPECHTGVTRAIDCNMCVCGPNEKWACTKKTCIALTLREKASYTNGSFTSQTEMLHEKPDFDEDCNEGETKKLGCNVCVCFMNAWSCTEQECPSSTTTPKPVYTEEACQTEDDIKSMDCNVCHCKRGIWVCTKNDCKRFGDDHRFPYRPLVGYMPSRNKFKFRSGSKNRGVAIDQGMLLF